MLTLMVACSEPDPTTPDAEDPARDYIWKQIDRLPAIYTLSDAWGLGPDDVLAVGPDAAVLRWDGMTWSPLLSSLNATLDLWCVWAAAADTFFVAGDNGVIARWTRVQVETMASPTDENLRGLWGSSPDDVFAVGDAGVVLHFDGDLWTRTNSAVTTALFGVWGSAHDDVFAVGLGGAIVHYDGGSWARMPVPTSALLAGIAGTDGSNVFAVGNSGTILHYDGSTWSPMESGTRDVLHAVVAFTDGRAVAAGENGTILSYNGSLWGPAGAGATRSLFGATLAGSEAVVVGTGTMLRGDGITWTVITAGAVPRLNDIWGESAGALFAVGDDGAVYQSEGSQWHFADTGRPIFDGLNAVWGSASDSVYAVGENSRTLHYDGSAWLTQLGATGNLPDLYDVWGETSDDVWAVGDEGTINRLHGGAGWVTVNTGRFGSLRGIWGERADRAFAVGLGGEIIAWNGAFWAEMNVAVTDDLYDITGICNSDGTWSMFAAGAGGTVLTFDETGNEWVSLDTGITEDLFALSPGCFTVLYAAGANGMVYRYNGQWSVMSPPTGEDLRALCSMPGTGEIFTVGGARATGGVMFHFGPP